MTKKQPKPGDRATCEMCGSEIEYVGPYWQHIGENQPKHPAVPKEDKVAIQSTWFWAAAGVVTAACIVWR